MKYPSTKMRFNKDERTLEFTKMSGFEAVVCVATDETDFSNEMINRIMEELARRWNEFDLGKPEKE